MKCLLWPVLCSFYCFLSSCEKGKATAGALPTPVTALQFQRISINQQVISQPIVQLTNNKLSVELIFSDKISKQSIVQAVTLKVAGTSTVVPVTFSFFKGDSAVMIEPTWPLDFLTLFSFQVDTTLRSVHQRALSSAMSTGIRTGIDPSNKMPLIHDDALLDTVQRRTFKFFWEYGHPLSGMARDKTNTSDMDDCAVGGTGFGLLCLPVAVSRNFITREAALERMQKIVDFLQQKAQTFHGAFAHRINGITGKVITWQPKDDGADLVETSFLMMGLLTARQFFNSNNPAETSLRNKINTLYNNVEWTWFQKDNQKALYWLWSPTHLWDASFMVRGWNETLITYIMAASSTTYPISKEVYDAGFANHGGLKNGQSYYGIPLPLGEAFGGPLFLSQYSFLAINPNGLSDAYANYDVQVKNHTLINRAYCMENPKNYFGYSDSCWGLTASSTNVGYTPCSPTKDLGVIAPTAALSSFAFTPKESMAALKYFYYRLGNYVWKEYGFVDACNLSTNTVWVGSQELVYNQLPIMIAIENYRTGLIWNLFTSCAEVKAGMRKLGFAAPYL